MRLPVVLSWVAAVFLLTAAPAAADEPRVESLREFGSGDFLSFAFNPKEKTLALGWGDGAGMTKLDETFLKFSTSGEFRNQLPKIAVKGLKPGVFLAFT